MRELRSPWYKSSKPFWYHGGLLALALYNLLLYFSLKDKVYGYYSLYVLSLGLAMLAGNGLAKQLIWPDFPIWNRISQTHRFLNGLILAYCLMEVLLALSMYWYYSIAELLNLMLLLSIALVVTVILTSLKLIIAGHREYRFFLLAWSILSLGVIVASLRLLDWLPTNALTTYAVQIASGFEMLLLAFALADRINQETAQKLQYQQQTLDLKHSLVQSLTISEQNLEQQVKERTLALEVSLANEKQIRVQYIRFEALISHEFRNQLTITRLTDLFDKWLQDGRLNDDHHALSLNPIDLAAWLTELIEQYQDLQPEYRFELNLNPVVTELLADVDLLTLALKNLIDNACKYSPADSLISLEIRQQARMIGIAVIDQGLGIAPEYQQQIFSDYFRVNPESRTQGLGLGLSLVKRIINRHGGYIELTSTLGVGSCFCLWLKHDREADA